MMNKIRTNPKFAAAFYFVLTWIGFPIAALVISYVKGITFGAVAATPYLIITFALGSVVAAFQGYSRAKELTITQ